MSYGGLASFIGATFTPDVFCCSVPVVGITNLQTLLESMPPYWAGFAEFMYRSYGDPRTPEGRALLAERSPIHKVDRIKKPMLIFHGANDVRCKIAESDTIVAAMQTKGIPVTYVVYPDEGHGFAKPPNRFSYFAIAEAFFARHLGGACEPVGNDFEGSSHEVRAGADILADRPADRLIGHQAALFRRHVGQVAAEYMHMTTLVMSPLGHSRRSADVGGTSAYAPRAATKRTSQDFAFVPIPAVSRCSNIQRSGNSKSGSLRDSRNGQYGT